MDKVMHIKYFRIYTVDLTADRAVLIEGDRKTHIERAS